jgi:hypothetical protein
VPNVDTWLGRRAQLVLNSSFEDNSREAKVPADEDEHATLQGTEEASADGGSPPGLPAWHVRNRLLAAELGPWRILVATDARRLVGRDGGLSARWDDISGLLSSFALDAVDLRGVSRRIYVGAEQSGDVTADVRRIRQTISDEFLVTEVVVRRIGDEDDTAMEVDFPAMTVTAQGRAPMSSLITAAALLLAHRRPLDFAPLLDSALRLQ